MGELELRELFAGEGLIRFREYRAGETIIREGERDRWVYYLVSGQARVLSQEVEVAVLSRYGDIFGEMGPMDGASKKIKFAANGESGSNYIIRVVKDGKFANYWDPQTGKKF